MITQTTTTLSERQVCGGLADQRTVWRYSDMLFKRNYRLEQHVLWVRLEAYIKVVPLVIVSTNQGRSAITLGMRNVL